MDGRTEVIIAQHSRRPAGAAAVRRRRRWRWRFVYTHDTPRVLALRLLLYWCVVVVMAAPAVVVVVVVVVVGFFLETDLHRAAVAPITADGHARRNCVLGGEGLSHFPEFVFPGEVLPVCRPNRRVMAVGDVSECGEIIIPVERGRNRVADGRLLVLA